MIQAQCKTCGEISFIEEKYCWKTSKGYKINKIINCSNCGNIIREVTTEQDSQNQSSINKDEIKCPQCKFNQITANKKGFGLCKAVTGGVLLGPVGLLGGFLGSSKVEITCLKCGYKWKPGK